MEGPCIWGGLSNEWKMGEGEGNRVWYRHVDCTIPCTEVNVHVLTALCSDLLVVTPL